jgi:hypothetical protein
MVLTLTWMMDGTAIIGGGQMSVTGHLRNVAVCPDFPIVCLLASS